MEASTYIAIFLVILESALALSLHLFTAEPPVDPHAVVDIIKKMGEKAQKAAPWAGLIAAVPALAMALQSYFEARGASKDVQQTEIRSEERDDKGWRFTRHVLERQQDEIEGLYERVEELEEALEGPTPLLKRIERRLDKPAAPPEMPSDFDVVQEKAEELREF